MLEVTKAGTNVHKESEGGVVFLLARMISSITIPCYTARASDPGADHARVYLIKY